MVTVGLFFMLVGLINGTPGAIRVGTVYVLWPLVYLVLVAGMSDDRIIRGLSRVLVAATFAVGLYGLSYVLFAVGWLPRWLYLPLDQGQGIGFYEGYVEVSLYSLASLLFLVPYLIAALLCWEESAASPASRPWLWLGCLTGIALVLLSGRRALMLVTAMAPVITLIFLGLTSRRALRANFRLIGLGTAGGFLILFGLGSYLNAVSGFEWGSILAMFGEGFNFSSEVSATVRRDQFFALLHGWDSSPILGAGHGAAAPRVIRSAEFPWAYELSYVALLFHTGIVGFLAYASAIGWIYWMGLRILRSGDALARYMLPILVGMSCFLVGNATNPYLEKFDYIWVLFLPIGVINHWLLSRDGPNRESQGAMSRFS